MPTVTAITVERLARAIRDEQCEADHSPRDYDRISESLRESLREEARLVLRAMIRAGLIA